LTCSVNKSSEAEHGQKEVPEPEDKKNLKKKLQVVSSKIFF